MDINQLSLKAYYESHKDEYVSRRLTGLPLWDEGYKWDILPKLNAHLRQYESINPDNISEIIAILQKANPNAGSFCHWTDFDNLQKLVKNKPTVAKALAYAWRPSASAKISGEIDSINTIINQLFGGTFRLSPAAFGYLLAAQDCDNFAIYNDKLIQDVADLNHIEKPKTQGEKYQLLNDTARYIGSLMAQEKERFAEREFYYALNGQDFLYVIIQYPKSDRS